MKISVQSAPLYDRFGVDKMCEILKKAGFDGIDFNFDTFITSQVIKEKQDSILYHKDQTIEFAKQLKAKLDEYDIKVLQAHSPFPTQFPLWDEATNARMMEAQKNSLYACQILDCPILVIHPYFYGNAHSPTSYEEEYEGNIKMYSELIPIIKETKITVCLENMWSQNKMRKIFQACCSDANEAIIYIDELNKIAGEELFGFCCDIGHLTLVGIDPYKFITKLGSRIKCFHIHDNFGVDDDHYFPFIGTTVWDRFYKAIKDIDYKGNFDFETSGTQSKLFKDESLMQPAYNLLYAIADLIRENCKK